MHRPRRQAGLPLPGSLSADEARLSAALQSDALHIPPLGDHQFTVGAFFFVPADKQFDAGLGAAVKYAFRGWERFELNGEVGAIDVDGDPDRGATGDITVFPMFFGGRFIQDIPDVASVFLGLGIGWVWVQDRNVITNGIPVTIDHTYGAYASIGLGYPSVFQRGIFEIEYRFLFAEAVVPELVSMGVEAELSGHQIRINIGYMF